MEKVYYNFIEFKNNFESDYVELKNSIAFYNYLDNLYNKYYDIKKNPNFTKIIIDNNLIDVLMEEDYYNNNHSDSAIKNLFCYSFEESQYEEPLNHIFDKKFNLITIFNDYWLNNEQKKNTFEILNKGLDNLSYDEYEYISELFFNPEMSDEFKEYHYKRNNLTVGLFNGDNKIKKNSLKEQEIEDNEIEETLISISDSWKNISNKRTEFLYHLIIKDRLIEEVNKRFLNQIEFIVIYISEEREKEFNKYKEPSSKKIEKINSTNNQPIKSDIEDNIKNLANVVFSHDLNKLEQLKYIVQELNGYRKNFSDLTKYNQIYSYFNEIEPIPTKPYKELIKGLFGFNYDKRQIKGSNQRHQLSIKKISQNFEAEQKKNKIE